MFFQFRTRHSFISFRVDHVSLVPVNDYPQNYDPNLDITENGRE